MAKTVSLKASARSGVGRAAVKKLRQSGEVPAVLYGKAGGPKAQSLSINARELDGLLHHATSQNLLVDLELAGAKRLALLQDVQFHPLKDYIIHVDLHEIAQNEKLHAEVPVLSTGEPLGVKNSGGIFETIMRNLRVECLPKDLPEKIVVDVSHLEVGKAVHVGDIAAPEGVVFMNAKDLAVFMVVEPKVEEAPVAVTEIQQPEVIKEKKAEGEEGAAPADAKAKPAESRPGGTKDADKSKK
jgi:large subunit ribosomal protein L25